MDATSQSLEDLLAQTAARDRTAFHALYERTSGKLFAVCLSILRSRGLAEDALQEAYVRIWNHADRYDPAKAVPMTWMISIARNGALSYRRKIGRVQPVEDAALDAMVNAEAASASVDPPDAADLQALERCLDELGADQSDVVRKAYLFGYSHSELARATGAPLGTIKTRIRRALQHLRECLDDGQD